MCSYFKIMTLLKNKFYNYPPTDSIRNRVSEKFYLLLEKLNYSFHFNETETEEN